MKEYFVYILASGENGTLYVGVTNNMLRRLKEHKEGISESFTKKYSVNQLVYFESYEEIELALRREKQLKKWNRAWKIQLIVEFNPSWEDLYKKASGY